MRLLADAFLILPQHVRFADQPMLMRFVELEALAVAQQAGAADQGDIVEPDDVEAPAVEKFGELPRMRHRAAELVGEQAATICRAAT